MTLPMDILPEVAEALAANRPVVALESTIISHGMPYPRNVETARMVEDAVRAEGAVPATIAVLDGRLRIGIDDAMLERLGDPQDRSIVKLSRRDLAACLASGGSGATTVATTMIAARLAGIDVFATGGIGGVHKGAEQSFDVSADLHELARTPVIVVCAGAKAILDIPKTLEVLETLGVPVTTYGQSLFPAFWSRQHPDRIASPAVAMTREAMARDFLMSERLGLGSGMLVANPVPAEAEIPGEVMAPIIDRAVREAERDPDARGKDATPFLLRRIFELTEGRSLEANIALVLNNAQLAAKIAADLAEMRGNT
jgi:pseudouridine-5'-phosphate glycosidase